MTDNERKGFDELLRRVTAKYNEVVDKNYNEGLFWFKMILIVSVMLFVAVLLVK